jgi:DNA adenine methylase
MTKYNQEVLWPEVTAGASILKTKRLAPLLKWAGGKEQELKNILPLIPSFDKYYEPFVGGGAVFFSIQSQHKLINDRSQELFNFYLMIAQNDKDFFHSLDILLAGWHRISDIVESRAIDLISTYKTYSQDECSIEDTRKHLFAFIRYHTQEFTSIFEVLFNRDVDHFIQELQRNLLSKVRRMKELEHKKWKLPDQDILANIESALKSAFYMHLRYLYNKTREYEIPLSLATAIFFFVRENAYASMFRYNSQGGFNVPYGGISYNRKDLARKIVYLRSLELRQHLRSTIIENMDFEAFLLKYPPQVNDFIFLDPPYDSEFSTYAQNQFDMKDQERLANYLFTQCQARFLLVIKNTRAILNLYNHKGLNIQMFDKKYLVSFQDRNDRKAEHLIITNY